MQKLLTLSTCFAVFLAGGCVPKTQYDDTQAKLKEAQSKLQQMENSSAECDKDTFMQLREQAQSLDLLTQELVDRNTELSKEVARLKVFEAASKNENLTCDKRIENEAQTCQGKLDRARSTYEDLVNELRGENKRLKEKYERPASSQKTPAAAKKPKPSH